MVIVTYQMQKPVDDDTVKFILEVSPELQGVLPHGIHAYEKVSGKTVALAIVESDDVREIVVLQELLVYVEDIVVGTEDYGDVPYPANFAFRSDLEPFSSLPPVAEHEISVLKIIRNHKSKNQNDSPERYLQPAGPGCKSTTNK